MGGLFGGKSQSVSTSSPVIGSLRLQTSSRGKAIPVVFGKARVSPNLIDYQDFTAIPHTENQNSGGGGKGGGGGTTYSNTTYTYTAAVMLALCECGSTPINAVTRVWADKSAYPNAESLGFSVFAGSMSQSPWGYMQSAHADRALSYRGIAYVAAGAYDLGDSAAMPNHTFEVDTGTGYSGAIRDANPAFIITKLLTDPHYGAGFPADKIADMSAFSDYCAAQGIFLSPVYVESQQAQQAILQIADICNAEVSFSAGKLRFLPRADASITGNGAAFTPNLTPVYDLSPEDYKEPLRMMRTPTADAYNRVVGKFNNRANDYNEELVEAKDQAAIEIFGLRSAPDFDLSAVADAAVAQTVAQLRLQRVLHTRNTWEIVLGWKYILLEELDIITLTDPLLGIDRLPVRILAIDEDDYGYLTCTAEELQIGVASPARYEQSYSDAYHVDYNVPAPSVLDPQFFTFRSTPLRPAEEISFGIAAAGIGDNWGGCNVWMSWDGNDYRNIGRIIAPARYGKCTSAISAEGSVNVSINGQLTSSTTANAANNSTLTLLGDELCAYDTAILTGSGNYSVHLAAREQYGTEAGAVTAGTRFIRLDDAIFWLAMPPEVADKTLYVKLTSFNPFSGGQQGLSDVAASEVHLHPIDVPPPDVAALNIDNLTLTWPAVAATDLAGYEVRIRKGNKVWWGGAVKVHSGSLTECRYTFPRLPTDLCVIMVAAVDGAGLYSRDPAYVIANYGTGLMRNVVVSYPQQPAWSGAAIGCTPVSGALTADTLDAFYLDDIAPFYGYDNAPLYSESQSASAQYQCEVLSPALRSDLIVSEQQINAAIYELYFQLDNQSVFYEGAEDSFYTDDTLPFYGAPTDWLPLVGGVSVGGNQLARLKLVIPAQVGASTVDVLTPAFDVPDQITRYNDVSVPVEGLGIALPMGWIAITNVQITLQDINNGGVVARIVNKSATGFSVSVTTDGGASVAGVVDMIVQGY